jgi:hypothetical protein
MASVIGRLRSPGPAQGLDVEGCCHCCVRPRLSHGIGQSSLCLVLRGLVHLSPVIVKPTARLVPKTPDGLAQVVGHREQNLQVNGECGELAVLIHGSRD